VAEANVGRPPEAMPEEKPGRRDTYVDVRCRGYCRCRSPWAGRGRS